MRTFFKEGYHMLVSTKEMEEVVELAHAPSWKFVDLSNAISREDDFDSIKELKSDFHKKLMTISDSTIDWCMEAVRCHALLDELVKSPIGKILVNKALKHLES